MGFNTALARLGGAALLLAAAGALAHRADGTARGWVGPALLSTAALALAWRRGLPPPALPEPEPSVAATAVAQQSLAIALAQLEHLPVAAWLQTGEHQLKPLSSRARRLQAPGGVRDVAALKQRLLTQTHSGPVLLDTERGSDERWQLRRQPLALDGQAQVLLVLVPLEQALESESLLAWQQLVQVLTHEIMNSLTPIQSLSQTALLLLDEQDDGPAELSVSSSTDSRAEMRQALQAIALRAQSLSSFVRNYRRVSQWPAPQLAPVDLNALLARLQQAVGPAWLARGGAVSFELATAGLRLQADAGQLEQALLALLRNAEQATWGLAAPRLWVKCAQGRGGRLLISVRDNGAGVPAGLERQIFLPFFSAREQNAEAGETGGQGIGLTVVRQLVNGMGGRVRHVRPLEGGAAFVLSF
nr:ATP-binding protein [uncultured Roseateles sp.]